MNFGGMGMQGGGPPRPRPMIGPGSMRYKTEICRNFMNFGGCNRGEGCSFAHSEAELRPMPPQRAPRGPPMGSGNYNMGQRRGPNQYDQYSGGDGFGMQSRTGPQGGGYIGGRSFRQNQGGGMFDEGSRSLDFSNVDEGYLKQQQLIEMIDALSEYFSSSRIMQQRLKAARDFSDFGDYESAAQIITEIVYNPNASFAEKEVFQKIILLAVNNAIQYVNTKQKEEPVYQKPQQPPVDLIPEESMSIPLSYGARDDFDFGGGGGFAPEPPSGGFGYGGSGYGGGYDQGLGGYPSRGPPMNQGYGPSFGGGGSGMMMDTNPSLGGAPSFLNRPMNSYY
eukprot:TRINITY_DN4691_c0_g1_i5.p1 TRINITY_DN4691_c0_g1~~TRINITY_DN4691_c0_g1_i5.p1  ORF type:complete len:336 (-),score=72.77 TRINITY_DN4691_c0_g1_i5:50-1057(-)